MATIIEVKEDKLEHLEEYAEKVVKYGHKLLECLEHLEREEEDYKEKYSKRRSKKEDRDEEDRPRYY